MGMFDEVIFRYRMPDGRVALRFQTKDLECQLDQYEITPSGRLVRSTTIDENERPLGDLNHHGWLNIHDSGHCYRLDFEHGSLRAVQVRGEDGWLLFDPANCIEN